MPVFRRSDGDLVTGESPLRRIMPYVMRGRNESLVFHAAHYQVGPVLRMLQTENRGRAPRSTMFEFLLWAIARVMHRRPRLNRFVSGGRIYQRRGVFVSFAARAGWGEGDPLVSVKLAFPEGETFLDCSRRIAEATRTARAGHAAVDGELALAMHVPGPLVRGAVSVLRLGDRLNLLPGSWIDRDPLYTSAFAANLGSLGLSDTFHHLYEYGTAGVFAAMGRVADETVTVNWTFDERVSDGRNCALALGSLREVLEHPEGA